MNRPATFYALRDSRDEPNTGYRHVQGFAKVWDAGAIDALTEAVITRLLIEGGTARAAAMELAETLAAENPTLPALSLALPFSLAAAGIEEMLGAGPAAQVAAHDAWRVAALIGAEALALRAAGGDTIADLWARWAAGDEVFGA